MGEVAGWQASTVELPHQAHSQTESLSANRGHDNLQVYTNFDRHSQIPANDEEDSEEDIDIEEEEETHNPKLTLTLT